MHKEFKDLRATRSKGDVGLVDPQGPPLQQADQNWIKDRTMWCADGNFCRIPKPIENRIFTPSIRFKSPNHSFSYDMAAWKDGDTKIVALIDTGKMMMPQNTANPDW